jgi:hypothetical protein
MEWWEGMKGMGVWVRLVWVVVLVWGVCCCVSSSVFGLVGGRVYEMVTPLYKGGYGASPALAVAFDGESVVFSSLGNFGGGLWDSTSNTYLARRGSGGWFTTSLQPPYGSVVDISSDLQSVLAQGSLAPKGGVEGFEPTGQNFLSYRTDTDNVAGDWGVVGGRSLMPVNEDEFPGEHLGFAEMGASGDLCHIVVGLANGALLPEAEDTLYAGQLYDLAGGCGGEPSSLKLIGVKNSLGVMGEPEVINRYCPAELGVGNEYQSSAGGGREQRASFNAIAEDGKKFFFTVNVEGGGKPDCKQGPHQLFVRVGGSQTLEISKPLSESESESCGELIPCPSAVSRGSAYFKGAAENGSRVFFTTQAPLVEGEGLDGGNDLYMATIGCGEGQASCEAGGERVTSLVRVSRASTGGEAAEVQGVLRVAQDGTRVYFVARGVLSEDNVEGVAPVKGADNLYVYDAETGGLAFVADLCSGDALSGGVDDSRCPTTLTNEVDGINDTRLWLSAGAEAQSTPDGEFLVFSSYGQLVKSDTNSMKDVYRYDATTGLLDRVSLGENGADANGNELTSNASINGGGLGPGAYDWVYEQQESGSKTVSEDGSRVVFASAAPLSPKAVSALANIYEWRLEPGESEGLVSLVSGGRSLTPDSGEAISPSGRDLFFSTSEGLVPLDTEGDDDIYDARFGGGFAPVPASLQQCSSSACQSGSNPNPVLVPGSVSQAPGGNFAPSKKQVTVKKKKKESKKKSGKKRKAKRKGGR